MIISDIGGVCLFAIRLRGDRDEVSDRSMANGWAKGCKCALANGYTALRYLHEEQW